MKQIEYSQIKEILTKYLIKFSSSLTNDTKFDDLNSVEKSEKNDLSFFSNIKYLDKLKTTKAKACLINKEFSKYLPDNCIPILVYLNT